MSTSTPLESSDDLRSGRPLRYARSVAFEGHFPTELGGALAEILVTYETYGTLSAARDNAVLICHALSGDSHVARHDETDDIGWWEIAVGPGKAIDTDRYFVVCSNVLGGCRGTTGPSSTNPATGRPYGADFPIITAKDMVRVQHRLMEHLAIPAWLAVLGASMGGHQVLTWATEYPEQVRGAIAIATSPRLSAQSLAFDVVGRNAILRDPHFAGGQYYGVNGGPEVGLAIARMLAHVTYLSSESMDVRFGTERLSPREVTTEFEKRFSVGSYLAHQGHKFVERFDANSYVTLSLAMDLFDLGRTEAELFASLAPARCRWLILSFTSDWLFPPSQSHSLTRALTRLGKSVSACTIDSACGHDAFLLPDQFEMYGGLTRAFLANVAGTPEDPSLEDDRNEGPASAGGSAGGDPPPDPKAPRLEGRLDYQRIVALTPAGCRVLDLGCGSGALLSRLRADRDAKGVGVEIDEHAVLAGLRRGHDVLHADIRDALALFEDGAFDTVVLSQTLQTVWGVEATLTGMLRVGRQCIVSFPNFAYGPLREMLAIQGRAPRASGLLHAEWHCSPNIRFFSILDFEHFCAERGFVIERRVALNTESGEEIREGDVNALADLAIFVLSGRNKGRGTHGARLAT